MHAAGKLVVTDKSPASVVWFRRDMRLLDNQALCAAMATGYRVHAIYIVDELTAAPWLPGGASRWYLHHSLVSLQASLARIGIRLYLFKGDPVEILPRFTREVSGEHVVWNYLAEPSQLQVDRKLEAGLKKSGCEVEVFHDDTLLPPMAVQKQDGSHYKVFTPFWKRSRELLLNTDSKLSLRDIPRAQVKPVAFDPADVSALELLDDHSWHDKLHDYWQPGEAAANARMEYFLSDIVADYSVMRDVPAEDGTSRLSAALHFGELSVTRAFARSQEILQTDCKKACKDSLLRFQSELGWREFARYTLMQHPRSTDTSLDSRFETDWVWQQGTDLLSKWQHGKTGIPLVDAGMRQLWQTGWMHNRVRMICASFLTKNLGIHWIHGARWFWDTLVDADLASNTLGWQWVAGCGTDAAPYYRVFNPLLQAGKFDPNSTYVKRWLGDEVNEKPIVDVKKSRVDALARYQAMRDAT